MSRTIVFQFDADYGDPLQVLVILDDPAPPHCAVREKAWHGWSVPGEVVEDHTDERTGS